MERKSRARAAALCMLQLRDKDLAEVEPRLYISSVGGASNEEALKQHGITHILCVAKDLEPQFPEKFVYGKIQVLDQPGEDIAAHFATAFEFIDHALESDTRHKVLVHCFQGKSRSATVIAAYLIQNNGYTLEKAMEKIRTNRPTAQPNIGFGAVLARFAKQQQTKPSCN